MVVTDSYENEYDRWTTDGSNHIISGLIEGEYYTLTESITPEGYEPAEPITFTYQDGSVYIVTYDENGDEKLHLVSDQTIVMIDNKQGVTTISTETIPEETTTTTTATTLAVYEVQIAKQDQTSETVVGAELVVTDSYGNEYDRWTTDGSNHIISGLIEGEYYTLTESITPEGYEPAEPITFTYQDGSVYIVTYDENDDEKLDLVSDQTIVMIDNKQEETTTTTTTKNRVDQDDQNVTTTTTVKVATGNKTNNQNQSSSSSSGNRTSGTTNVRTASSPKTGDSMLPVVLTANAALLFAVCCKAKKRKK